ncbi:Death related ICE-like caspase [Carabus blaptoides fortunei]
MDNTKENKAESESKKIFNGSMRKSKNRFKNNTTNNTEAPKTNIMSNFNRWKKGSGRNKGKKSGASTDSSVDSSTYNTVTDAGMSKPPTYVTEPIKGALMVTEPHAEEYFMSHKRRGKAIILNHEHFDKEDSREGTQIDVDRLTDVLSTLKFEVEVHKDLEYFDIIQLGRRLSKEDFTDCDCIAFFILTHGNKRKEISARDVYYDSEKLWENFTGDNCVTLAGKPKLFFINACRGKKKDAGIRFFGRGRTEADYSGKPNSYKIPKHADFLMAYSTVDGHLSYRDRSNGTWFIQCLCDVLQEYHDTKDLLKMLTITARKVAIDYRTQSDLLEECDLTQVPSITTMLIRDVYLRTT